MDISVLYSLLLSKCGILHLFFSNLVLVLDEAIITRVTHSSRQTQMFHEVTSPTG